MVGRGMAFLDLIQEGNLVWWKQSINLTTRRVISLNLRHLVDSRNYHRAIADQARTIRIPSTW